MPPPCPGRTLQYRHSRTHVTAIPTALRDHKRRTERAMLTAVHILLTYQCTYECDHCFLHCGPQREGTFSVHQLRQLLHDVQKIPTIDTVYFEGGEPFLFYATLLAGLQIVRDAGLRSGIVTN